MALIPGPSTAAAEPLPVPSLPSMHDPQDDHRNHWALACLSTETVLPAIESTLQPPFVHVDFRPGHGLLADRRLVVYRRPIDGDLHILAMIVDSPAAANFGKFQAVTAYPAFSARERPITGIVVQLREWLTTVEGRLDIFLGDRSSGGSGSGLESGSGPGPESLTVFAADWFANRPWYAAGLVTSFHLSGLFSRIAIPQAADLAPGNAVRTVEEVTARSTPADEVRLVGTIRSIGPLTLVDGPGRRIGLEVEGLGIVPLAGLQRGADPELPVGSPVMVDAWLQVQAAGEAYRIDRFPRLGATAPDLTHG